MMDIYGRLSILFLTFLVYNNSTKTTFGIIRHLENMFLTRPWVMRRRITTKVDMRRLRIYRLILKLTLRRPGEGGVQIGGKPSYSH